MIGCVCRCGRTFMISNLPRSKILQGNRDQAAGGGAMHWLLGAIYAMGWAVPLSMQNTKINRLDAMYHIKGKEYTSTWLTWLIGQLCFSLFSLSYLLWKAKSKMSKMSMVINCRVDHQQCKGKGGDFLALPAIILGCCAQTLARRPLQKTKTKTCWALRR